MHEKERARREGKGMDVPSRRFGALRGCAVRASEPWHPECEIGVGDETCSFMVQYRGWKMEMEIECLYSMLSIMLTLVL